MVLARLIGGPLHDEALTVGKATLLIELDLGDGTLASYRLNVGGFFSYDGIRPASNRTSTRARVAQARIAIAANETVDQ